MIHAINAYAQCLHRSENLCVTYFSSKVFASNHTITGKFLRSLYVGRSTEYLSPFAISSIMKLYQMSVRSEDATGYQKAQMLVKRKLERVVDPGRS